ncbi:MAG: hypothetical protein ACLTWR_04145 [Agathobaculum desmolans]|uniref:hypothetical protein n=1 Tax=Agathobaculum desmolans TaxID=39484 RepID=UPI0004E21CD1|nr:hypothetical protein [Agathobaculum desmolans]
MNRNNTLRRQCRTMIEQMSPEALACCCEAISWAYYWTDGHDPNRLTAQDAARYHLLGDSMHWDDPDKFRLIETFGNALHGIKPANPSRKGTNMQ